MTLKQFIIPVAIVVTGFVASCQHASPDKTATLRLNSSIPDSDTVSYQTALQYVKNYGNMHYRTSKGGIDTRCAWFGIDRLKALIAKIDSEKGSGVRIYFGTYDTTYSIKKGSRPPGSDIWGHNTVLLVSTRDSIRKNGKTNDTLHWDFYSNKVAQTKGGGIIIMTTPENRGEICPPPSNCAGATLITN